MDVTITASRPQTADVPTVTDMSDVLEEQSSVWGMIARWGVFLIALLMPLWFLPLTENQVDGNKLFFVSVLILVGFVAWLGMAVQGGVFRLPRFIPLYALGVWVLVYFLAAFFSLSPETSLWAPTSTSAFHMLIGGLLVFLVAVTLRLEKGAQKAYTYILASAAIIMLFLFVQTIMGIDIFQWDFAKLRTFNPIGQWNVIGIFFGFILVSIFPFLSGTGEMSRLRRYGLIVFAFLALLVAVVVNYRMVWLGVAVVSVIYLAYAYSRTSGAVRARSVTSPLLFLFASVLFFLSQDMISVFTTAFNPPLDITPSISSSFQVAGQVLRERPVLGIGPDMFGNAWDRFKDPLVNSTVYWRLRFATASSFATTLLTTTGILGLTSFLLFVGSILWVGFSLIHKLQLDNREHQFIISTFFGLLFLLSSWFFYPLTVVVATLTFLVLGLFVAELSASGFVSQRVFVIHADSAKGFLIALVVVFLMVLSVLGLYVRTRKQVAAIEYGRGVAALLENDSVNEAEAHFRRAVLFDGSRDIFHSAITQTSSIKLQRVLQNAAGETPEVVQNNFQATLSSAITSAQEATEANGGNSANWRLLGQIYELVVPYVGGAAEAAAQAYREAVRQAPSDPLVHDDLARVSMVLGDYVKAREELEAAIRLKSDFAAAHFRLAQIAVIKGNVDDAIANTERAALSAPNDIGILFQLGLLYYQQNRHDDARLIFERAVQINPNYSNARYFLGLVYAAGGDRSRAIEQFEFIQSLNPENTEVKVILNNLKEGKEPLAGITPPPLNRDSVPVSKEGDELEQRGALEGEAASEEAVEEGTE
ncbi:MAG: Tfp pilus assembly protein PilF [Parcubacteria group bacterium Gr01-1014_70]|nr:MAG: Tfp pilus assembly protein PilF [Parcubacteria group bacterium Gr01-1014_70]